MSNQENGKCLFVLLLLFVCLLLFCVLQSSVVKLLSVFLVCLFSCFLLPLFFFIFFRYTNVSSYFFTIYYLWSKKKRLTVSTSKRARVETHHLRVELSFQASVYTWLDIVPHHKIHSRGDNIQYGASIRLACPKLPSHYITIAKEIIPTISTRDFYYDCEIFF